MRLYHYLSTSYAVDDLERRRLKIAKIEDLNDPFELLAPRFDTVEQRQIWEGWREAQKNRWGALCFSKTWRNPVMWSHYADRHRGMCFGFDIPNNLLMFVLYKMDRPTIDVEKLHRNGRLTADVINRVLRTKYSGWSYEREVRVYANLNDRDPETGLFFAAFGPNLKLAEVIAGPLCHLELRDIEKAMQTADSDVSLKRARLASRRFQVIEDN